MLTHTSAEDLSFVSPSISQGTTQSYLEDGYQDSAHERSSPEAPSIEQGNKLLSFKASVSNYPLLGLSMRRSQASLAAQLHGMFFLGESSRTTTGEFTTSPPELTCYRRNLFQITGSVTLPRMLQYAISDRGERLPIISQELTISATESVENSSVKIISVPWKTPAGSTPPLAEDKAEKEPTPIALDHQSSRDVDAEFSVYPIAWKRLQFRVATANNGRRKELQQHFILRLSVVATLEDGSRISLCDAYSGPVIVRGRSPRNFQARKDVPLSGNGTSIRKTISALPPTSSHSLRRSATHPSSGMSNGIEGVDYALSPSRHESPAVGLGLKQQSYPGTPPISPFHINAASEPFPSDTSLKRKMDDSHVLGRLASTQAGDSYAHRSSAPPQGRPRKVLRGRGNTVGGEMATSMLQQTSPPQAPSALPSGSFSYAPSVSAPGFFGTLKGEPTTDSIYFGSVDEWLPPTDPYYRPHTVHAPQVPPVTSVGGAMLGHGSYWASK